MLQFTPPPLARDQRRPEGFIPPALLTPAKTVPTGPGWIHELKHDGIRLIARKDGDRVQLWSRHGRSRTADFGTIVAAIRSLKVRSAVLDGEAVAHCEKGLPDFHRTLSSAGQQEACLLAFDLLAVDGEDLRLLPLLARRSRLQAVLADAPHGLLFSEHMDGEHGEAMFRHACAMGLEGIVSKKITAPYLSGRRSCWRKIKPGLRQGRDAPRLFPARSAPDVRCACRRGRARRFLAGPHPSGSRERVPVRVRVRARRDVRRHHGRYCGEVTVECLERRLRLAILARHQV